MRSSARLGIIETLSEGFAQTHKGLWGISIPILVDLLLWLGPKISIAPLVSKALDLYQRSLAPSSSLPKAMAEDLGQSIDRAQEIGQVLSQVNFLGLITWQLPSLQKATGIPLPPFEWPWQWEIASGWAFLGFAGGMVILGLLAYCLYLGILAQLVRGDPIFAGPFLGRVSRNGLRLLAYFGILALFGLPAAVGFMAVIGVVSLFSPGVASFLTTLALSVLLALLLYLFFADDAIFLGDVGPLRAAWYSASLVWRNFWSSVAFILLTNIVLIGTPLAWRLIMGHPLGVLLAIGGHAYIATGITTAGMIFYRQRYIPRQEESFRNNPSAPS